MEIWILVAAAFLIALGYGLVAVLTRALAVLGLLAFPLTGAATVAIGLGATVYMVLTLLLVALVGVASGATVLLARRDRNPLVRR